MNPIEMTYMAYRDIESALRAKEFMGVRDWKLCLDREKGRAYFASRHVCGRLTVDEARRVVGMPT